MNNLDHILLDDRFVDITLKIREDANNSSSNAVYILIDTGVGFQPLSHFSYNISDKSICNSELPKDDIEGYKLWINIFEDVAGGFFSVYYPNKPRKNKFIKVIVKGEFIDGYVEWVHGESGLFEYKISRLLEVEDFFLRFPYRWDYKSENNIANILNILEPF